MKLKELFESRNSSKKNLRAEKPNEISSEKIALENWKLEKLFSFEANLNFYENSQNLCYETNPHDPYI